MLVNALKLSARKDSAMDLNRYCPGCFSLNGNEGSCPECGYREVESDEVTLYLPPRTLLAGKYLIGRVLGQGGFGITYLGWDTNLDIKLAIKEFFPQGLVSRVPGQSKVASFRGSLQEELHYGIDRFLSEAKMLAKFEYHPNIVSVRDFFRANNTAYMVMNYVEGFTLGRYLAEKGGKIAYRKAIDIVMPVLDALREVHAVGILHRDISPDNIFIDNRGRVVLLDFGAARQEMRDKSRSFSVILKAGYAPEEQYRTRGLQGPWTDIYAVAATLYRCIAGEIPTDAVERMVEDDLIPPSQLGIAIDTVIEQALLKALAVKAEDRFQRVEEFQAKLLEGRTDRDVTEAQTGVEAREPVEPFNAAVEQEESASWAVRADTWQEMETAKVPPPLPPSAMAAGEVPVFPGSKTAQPGSAIATINKKAFLYVAVIVFVVLLIIGGINLLGGGRDNGSDTVDVPAIDPAVIAGLEAEYYIDYDHGTIPLGDLPIGARVADPSWEWEYRLGINYSDIFWDGSPTPPGELKPVTWIIVAKDHYDLDEGHVTLLTDNLIGLFPFDDSTDREHEGAEYGYNHWGDCGTGNATHGLRPWLNSNGIHSGEGFYGAFSADFKRAVLTTPVPNREWLEGSAYTTSDKVFIPSTTELGDEEHDWTLIIGEVYAYFDGAGDDDRVALIVGDGWSEIVDTEWGEDFTAEWEIYGNNWFYWTRSPDLEYGYLLRCVYTNGDFSDDLAHYSDYGVRPAVNLKSDILVSEIR